MTGSGLDTPSSIPLLVPGCKPNAAVVDRRYKVSAGEAPK